MKVLKNATQGSLHWDIRTHQVEKELNLCIKRLDLKIGAQLPPPTSQIPVSADKMIAELDQMLQSMQQITQHIRRLQILRAWLCNENSKAIRNLLKKESYQQYDETDLEIYVKQSFVQHHTLIS